MKCFEYHKKKCVTCKKKNCRYWISSKSHMNCTLICADEGPKTLQQIGDIFNITRMRVCQIEKKIINKIKSQIEKGIN